MAEVPAYYRAVCGQGNMAGVWYLSRPSERHEE